MTVWQGDEDANLEECKLLSGGFATLLQVLLGFIALSVLVLKRTKEVPQRPLNIWAFDASKQLVGAGFAHVANLLIAILLYQYENGPDSAAELAAEAAGVDQCAFYFVNFTMDTTIGVVFNWVFLEMVSSLALRCQWTALMTPGDYGEPAQVSIWLKQLSSWIVVIFVTKLVIALMIVIGEKPLAACALWLFAPLQPYPHVELVLVMIACPCLMNALQFWVQDSFLKKDARADHTLAATCSPSKADMIMDKRTGSSSSSSAITTSKTPKFVIDEDEENAAYATDSSTSTATSRGGGAKRRTASDTGELV